MTKNSFCGLVLYDYKVLSDSQSTLRRMIRAAAASQTHPHNSHLHHNVDAYNAHARVLLPAPRRLFFKIFQEHRNKEIQAKSFGDTNSDQCLPHMPRSGDVKQPDEYVPLQWQHCIWTSYMCIVSGMINSMSVRNLFRTPTTHFTGITTRFAIATSSSIIDERSAATRGWLAGNGAGDHPLHLFLVMLGFTIGAFAAGIVLTHKLDGQWVPLRMDYPSIHQWRWQHQTIITASLMLLSAAHFLIRGQDVDAKSGTNTNVVAPLVLTACACALLNTMFMLAGSKFLVLRACSVTGSVSDIFLLLGSSMRSRSARYAWKVVMLSLTWFNFLIGALIGAITYENDTFYQSHSLAVVLIILSPLCLLGAAFLTWQHFTRHFSSKISRAPHDRTPIADTHNMTSLAANDAPFAAIGLSCIIAESTVSPGTDAVSGATHRPDLFSSLQPEPLNLPRLRMSLEPEENTNEFEYEGIGMRIYQLPRVNVISHHDDMEMTGNGYRTTVAGSAEVNLLQSIRNPGEYEVLAGAHYAWVSYISFVAGALNAITMQGLFAQPVTAMTGITTAIATRMKFHPIDSARGSASYNSGELAALLISFGCGCFVCGFFLTQPSSADPSQYVLRRNDHPNLKDWKWKHQALVTACLVTLFMSYGIAGTHTRGDKMFAQTIDFDQLEYGGFLFACLCASFASGILNTLTSLGRRITIRSCHVTGTLNDIGLGVGFALRSGSHRFIWRVRLLVCTYISFWLGAIVGSLIFYSSWGDSAMLFPAILMTLAWFVGLGCIVVQRRRRFV